MLAKIRRMHFRDGLPLRDEPVLSLYTERHRLIFFGEIVGEYLRKGS